MDSLVTPRSPQQSLAFGAGPLGHWPVSSASLCTCRVPRGVATVFLPKCGHHRVGRGPGPPERGRQSNLSFAVAASHAPKELAPEEMPRCPGCLREEMTHYPLPSIRQFLKEPAPVIDTVASRGASSSPGEGGEGGGQSLFLVSAQGAAWRSRGSRVTSKLFCSGS